MWRTETQPALHIILVSQWTVWCGPVLPPLHPQPPGNHTSAIHFKAQATILLNYCSQRFLLHISMISVWLCGVTLLSIHPPHGVMILWCVQWIYIPLWPNYTCMMGECSWLIINMYGSTLLTLEYRSTTLLQNFSTSCVSSWSALATRLSKFPIL